MAKISLYLDRRYKKSDGTFPIKVKVSVAAQKSFLISTDIDIPDENWDDRSKRIVGNHPRRFAYMDHLQNRVNAIEDAVLSLDLSVMKKGVSEIKCAVMDAMSRSGSIRFAEYFAGFIASKRNDNTRQSYQATLDKILLYVQGRTIDLENIDFEWLSRFQCWMTENTLATNAQAVHFRNIRAVYNQAINEGLVSLDKYPFRRFKIKTEPTRKRSLTIDQLKQLRDYPCEPQLEPYRDIFMLIFYLGGINMIDLCHIKEIHDGYIEYKRSKTKQPCRIKVEPEAAEIIQRYKGRGYLLNILDRYADYKDFTHRMNQNLQRIGKVEKTKDKRGRKSIKRITPLFPDITTYWARHSVASIAVRLNIHEKVINKILGHADPTVNGINEAII